MPAAAKLVRLAVLTRLRPGFWAAATVTVESEVTAGPLGGSPDAVAVLVMLAGVQVGLGGGVGGRAGCGVAGVQRGNPVAVDRRQPGHGIGHGQGVSATLPVLVTL